MTTALWITNVVVGLLVIADMLYGRHMAKKWMGQPCCSMEAEEELNMDYVELEARDEEIERRVTAIEEHIKKPKRSSRKKSTKKK
jgi:hypothetical protein